MLIVIYLSIFPYFKTINPNSDIFGVDSERYIESIKLIDEDFSQIYRNEGSRPISYIVLYSIYLISNKNPVNLIINTNVIIFTIFILSIYMFNKEVIQYKENNLLSMMLLISGFQISAGFYSSYYSNLIGLSLMFFSLSLFFNSLKNNKNIRYILSIMLGFIVSFTHPWTYIQYFFSLFSTTICLILLYFNKKINAKVIKYFIVYVFFLLLSDLIKGFLIKGTTGVKSLLLMIPNIFSESFLINKQIALKFKYGGAYTNYILIILAIIGIIYLEYDNIPHLFLINLLFLSSSIFIIGDQIIMSRVIFNLPLNTLAAIGYYYLIRFNNVKRYDRFLYYYLLIYSILYIFRYVGVVFFN
jgi:hypothetical protein